MDLSIEERYFFMYLFSNEASSMCGLYPVDIRVIAFETGLDIPTIQAMFTKFEQSRKRKAMCRDGVVYVTNMQRYNCGETLSEPQRKRIAKDVACIDASNPCRIAYEADHSIAAEPTDTLPIPYAEPTDTLPVTITTTASVSVSESTTEQPVTPSFEPEPQATPDAIGAIWIKHTKTLIGSGNWQDLTDIATEYNGVLGHSGDQWVDDMLKQAVKNCNGPPAHPGLYLRKMAQGWTQQGYGGGKQWQNDQRNTEPVDSKKALLRELALTSG